MKLSNTMKQARIYCLTVSESDDTYDSTHCSYSTLHGPNCGGLYPSADSCREYLFLSAVRSDVLLMESMRLANGASTKTLLFTPGAILPGNLIHTSTSVLKTSGTVKRKL